MVRTSLLSFLPAFLFGQQWQRSEARIQCALNEECENTLMPASECVNGFCTNPFHNGGCLSRLLPGWDKIRICNSDDPPSAEVKGHCKKSPLGYTEVRISSQDWETAFFGGWILQILLSEILGVPASIETGRPDLNTDFYNVESSLDYGISYDFSSLELGTRIGDCRKVEKSNDPEMYQACSHVLPEAWDDDMARAMEVENIEEFVESPYGLEAVGEQHWYMPRFTAAQDPTLTNYLGLQGEQNRRKLAETFLRPTKWKDYCNLVSKDACFTSDDVAKRAPIDVEEENSFFIVGLYNGHFRATEKNDCDMNPFTCTGHIADYPCGWNSFVKPQTYHLGIALEGDGDEASDGYSYNHLLQIWAAANATKSNVMMFWFQPHPLYQEYLGSDAEFTPATLTPPTQACLNARINRQQRCGENLEEKLGRPEGSCDTSPTTLKKVIGKGLRDLAHDPNVPEELWSPAYDAIMRYQMTEFQLSDIIDAWHDLQVDPWGHDPREATCRWVVQNINWVQSFIPDSYPRVLKEVGTSHWDGAHTMSALALASILVLAIMVCSLLTCTRRRKKVIYNTQVEFLLLVLGGYFLINTAAVIFLAPPSDIGCNFAAWLANIGYCVALIPIVLKVDAINRLNTSGKQMHRVRLTKKELYGSVLVATFVLCCFLGVWTVLDPVRRGTRYNLIEEMNENGETVIQAIDYCESKSNLRGILNVTWQLLLLMYAAVLVFMASRVREDLNDTNTLRLLICSHFVFVCIRLSLAAIGGAINSLELMAYWSLTYSIDTLFALMILVFPKLFTSSEDQESDEMLPDLFLETTVMFANISGFTAWSSAREPNQVFHFLEIIYASFDEKAEKRKVFKVETVGDCYVAATGIPQPRKDHAVVMARFATDCMLRMNHLTKALELKFGPDTGDLSLRIGLHSGPVTGGFLKGKGARFQLFGSTMAMTGLMESTCKRGHIQVSMDTAELLMKAKKQSWLEKREDEVCTEREGRMESYWLNKFKESTTESSWDPSSYESEYDDNKEYRKLWAITQEEKEAQRKRRLIIWNAEVLHNILKQIVARREAAGSLCEKGNDFNKTDSKSTASTSDISDGPSSIFGADTMALEQVKEIICLPEFNAKIARRQKESESIEISEAVLQQLNNFVERIAHMYNANPFHNFEHASHVVLAVTKLMHRIIAPADLDLGDEDARTSNKKQLAATLHDHTYGITSDPLTQFACVFSALIHDVDHPGVPNPQLVKEDKQLAAVYNFRSVAEQNSFDLSWNVLMEHDFSKLVSTICANQTELARFRQLVINSVMATDLGDKELKELRQNRWEKAFGVDDDEVSTLSNARETVNRKATIVIEHLIQAADVAHMMQHWHVYREWNEKLFRETYDAYISGRSEKNPADFWYQGELGFFDFYIIPLAKKLSECGVFGVSSDENLKYAEKNRAEWAARGEEVVAKMIDLYAVK